MVLAGMLVEFFQYITTGPPFEDYSFEIHVIGNTLSMDLEEVLDLRDGLFWIIVNV